MTKLPKSLKVSRDTVTLSHKDWNAILDALDEVDDRRSIAESQERWARGEDDGLPIGFVERLFKGENPVRVWRDFRGLSTTALAKKAKVSQPYLSEIETGVKPGSVATLRKLAAALDVDIDDLAMKWSKSPKR